MTISLPPISYPAKPRAPFTGTPPQNLFPDRFPTEWKNITGKPYITVSSKGLANGQSEYINDGADFGPDSLQADGTLTTTCGIKEAVIYIGSLSYFPPAPSSTSSGIPYTQMCLKLLNGYFFINEDIPMPTGATTSGFLLEISGMGEYETVLLLANGLKGFTGSPVYKFLMKDLTFGQQNTNDIPISAINFSADGTNTTERFDFEHVTWTNSYPATSYSTGAVVLNNVSARSVFFTNCHFNINGGYGIYATATGSLNTMITVENDTPVGTPFYFNGVNTIALRNLNTYSASFTVGSCNKLIMDNVNYYDASGPLIMLLGSVYSLVIKNSICVQVSGSSFTDWIALASGVSSGIIYKCQLENVFTSFGTSNVNFIGAGVSLYVLRPNPNAFNNISNGNTYSLIFPAVALSTNPPVSGTVYRNTTPYTIEIDLPVYATTAGTAGTIEVLKGPTSTPTTIATEYVSGATASTAVYVTKVVVPATWYYEFTASGVTFGTASVFAE